MEKIPMTAAGHAALESELKRRTGQERPRIIALIAEARGHGDLSENAEYHAAKEAHGLNEGRVLEIEDQLSRAEIIDVSKLSGKTVKFGATVTLVDEDTEQKRKYQIVGDVEADVKGSFVQDCEVCCNPWRVRVAGRGARRSVDIQRADGSE